MTVSHSKSVLVRMLVHGAERRPFPLAVAEVFSAPRRGFGGLTLTRLFSVFLLCELFQCLQSTAIVFHLRLLSLLEVFSAQSPGPSLSHRSPRPFAPSSLQFVLDDFYELVISFPSPAYGHVLLSLSNGFFILDVFQLQDFHWILFIIVTDCGEPPRVQPLCPSFP